MKAKSGERVPESTFDLEEVNKEMNMPVGVCVKVASLRPKYSDLKQWCETPGHMLVTRHGRVFIGSGDNKKVFSYPASEWANPFTVKKYGLGKWYEKYLDEKLADASVRDRFLKLSEYDELGCFFNPGEKCHRDIIVKKLHEIMQNTKT